MLTKKVSGYRKVPMLEMGSPIRILLSTPDDSDCEVDDAFETISDITPESNSNKLSVEILFFIINTIRYYLRYNSRKQQQ
ncbi:hypothetical protein CDAR_247521 [Caerostris darwini]|uniref:Uncharacterized protein n=1 Tax=Caerostris darwini TaxID=1538125 RepID=A0AAV4RBI6_9ARAC|nr:hypothetical protein CDAR_247521 [Caerostris darwini]